MLKSGKNGTPVRQSRTSSKISRAFAELAKVGSREVGVPGSLPLLGHSPGVGPFWSVLRLSDTWQLVINTGTTIVTFLMVSHSKFAEP